jgi:DnaJ like chaperone protein
LDRISVEIKFKIAVLSASIGFFIGLFIGLLGADHQNIEKSMDMNFAVGLAFIFGILGFLIIPRIVFELSNPYKKLYMICGKIGIAFIKLSIRVFISDGKLSKKEIEHLNAYMVKEFSYFITLPLLDFISENKKLREEIAPISEPMLDVKLSYRIDILYRLFSLAAADRISNENEERVLREISKSLKLGDKRYDAIKRKVMKEKGYYVENHQEQFYQNQSKNFNMLGQFMKIAYNPFAVLKIEQNSTNEDVKKAYRNLVKKYHPDKSMQESEETRKHDAAKILEINEAYESIKKMRGIK